MGKRTTPNTTEADEALKTLRSNKGPGGEGTPHQLTNCPWCGTAIEPRRDIVVELPEKGSGRTLIYCGDPMRRMPVQPVSIRRQKASRRSRWMRKSTAGCRRC